MAPQNILIVDDDAKITGLLREFLQLRGCRCETFDNGDDAFASARKSLPDAVITDIKMPGMDGIALTRQLRLLDPDLPVMVMTGFAAEYSEGDALEAGASDFITKPFSLGEFGARFQKLIKDRRKLDELRDLAYQDALTGIANRKLFVERLQQAIELARRYRYMLAVLFLDLDRFKSVNDACGHDSGDLVLQGTARRLSAQVRRSDTVARLGGDEFGILLSRVDAAGEAQHVSTRLVEAVARPYDIKGNSCSVSASVGISLFPSCGEDADTLLAAADAAMYDVKKEGGNGCRMSGPR